MTENRENHQQISEALHTDCVTYMRSLPDKFFDLAIADPPYGTADVKAHDPRGRFGTRFNKYRDTSDTSPTALDVAPPQEFFDELRRVSCHQIIWGGNFFAMPPAKCFLVWVKTNIPEKFTMAMCEYAWTSLTGNAKVFYHSSMRDKQSGHFHPTEKPIALYQWLLRNYAQPGQRIFDPMMGSQSSRIAAYAMGYDYYGCEMDAGYYQRGCERFDRQCRDITPDTANGQPRQLRLF